MLICYLQCSCSIAYWGNMSAFLKGNKLIALAGFFSFPALIYVFSRLDSPPLLFQTFFKTLIEEADVVFGFGNGASTLFILHRFHFSKLLP